MSEGLLPIGRRVAYWRVRRRMSQRVTASLLVKLGEGELAWLAADRAMSVATGDVVLVAAAAVQLGQVLRATGQTRVAVSTMRGAAYRIAVLDFDGGPPPHLSLCGTLLVQAALAAARHGDERAAAGLLAQLTRSPHAPAAIIQLAATLGVSRA
ncbi:hypothetical protein Vqi01_47110 [Micromonospora qiuiae]|uniref:XRE family transcriptional regulator n=1 Tax=Micromonospora qiuiae TaxID=502268 RepID=A0ABQ4JJA6_9ACTN|nr:hypothetical protein [Micromonospora qiuiae]GIJ29549.1 hypothetical protein Vqi01_47110 [Micromonospora qiuiae]